jgi:chromate transporter
MGRNLCPDHTRRSIAVAAGAFLLWVPGVAMQVGVILGGGFLGWWLYRKATLSPERVGPANWRDHWVAGGMLALFFLLLILLPILAATTGRKEIALFDSFYRAGSLVFGGGHVILPISHMQGAASCGSCRVSP